MRYQGGKSRIATPLAQILNATGGACFVSLFCGSCSVESKVTGYDRIILNDKHKYLIALLRGVQAGYELPETITEEQYQAIRADKDADPVLAGFVGFGCSFGGKWFGGYARNKGGTNYAAQSKRAWKNKNGQKEVYVLDPGSAPTKMPKTFEGIKAKDLIGVPWMLAFALRADGWYLRQDIIWHKTNPMPESVKDRCTKSHEYIFLLSKSPRYYFNAEAIAEPVANSTKKRLTQNIENQNGSNRVYGKNNGPMKACAPRYGGNKYTATPDIFSRTKSGNLYVPHKRRNKRDVWTVCTKGFKGAHFATYPDTLILPCVLAGSKVDGTVLDPFCGSGTTLQVAAQNGRNGIGIEINAEYEPLIKARIGEYKREEVNNDG